MGRQGDFQLSVPTLKMKPGHASHPKLQVHLAGVSMVGTQAPRYLETLQAFEVPTVSSAGDRGITG